MIPYYGLILWTGILYGGIKHVRLKDKKKTFVCLAFCQPCYCRVSVRNMSVEIWYSIFGDIQPVPGADGSIPFLTLS